MTQNAQSTAATTPATGYATHADPAFCAHPSPTDSNRVTKCRRCHRVFFVRRSCDVINDIFDEILASIQIG